MCNCGLVPGKDPFWSRMPWTWLGVSVGSILFFLWATYLYQVTNHSVEFESFFRFLCFCQAEFLRSLLFSASCSLPTRSCGIYWSSHTYVSDQVFSMVSHFLHPIHCGILRCSVEGIWEHVLSDSNSNSHGSGTTKKSSKEKIWPS
jgi:hypothetical protein